MTTPRLEELRELLTKASEELPGGKYGILSQADVDYIMAVRFALPEIIQREADHAAEVEGLRAELADERHVRTMLDTACDNLRARAEAAERALQAVRHQQRYRRDPHHMTPDASGDWLMYIDIDAALSAAAPERKE